MECDDPCPHAQHIGEDSDEYFIARVCEGDMRALGALFRRHARLVRGVALKILRDASEADEMLQDIFLLIHNDCRKFDASKSPAQSWILQMTYRRAISRRRYLTSRHFYTCVDLEQTAETLPDLRGAAARYDQSMEAVIGRNTAYRMFRVIVRGSAADPTVVFFRGVHDR